MVLHISVNHSQQAEDLELMGAGRFMMDLKFNKEHEEADMIYLALEVAITEDLN